MWDVLPFTNEPSLGEDSADRIGHRTIRKLKMKSQKLEGHWSDRRLQRVPLWKLWHSPRSAAAHLHLRGRSVQCIVAHIDRNLVLHSM